MYPYSPQFFPKVFFNIQKSTPSSDPYPTSSIPRSISSEQSPSQIPPEQIEKFSDAIATVTGCCTTADIIFQQLPLGTLAHLPTVTAFLGGEQLQPIVLDSLQGYNFYVETPWSIMYQQAWSMNPPPQPQLPYSPEQSIICWSDSLIKFSILIAQRPSTAAIEEKAQLAGQLPSFITSLMTAFSVQLMLTGGSGVSGMLPVHLVVMPGRRLCLACRERWPYWCLNYWEVISANSLSPIKYLDSPLFANQLCSQTFFLLFLKI